MRRDVEDPLPTASHGVTDHVAGKLSDLDMRVVESVPPGGNWRDLPLDFPSQRIRQIRESAARGEGSRSTYYGRLVWTEPSYTISTYFTRPGNGAFIHPTYPRLLTVREAARLQTFPDWWRFSGSVRQRAMQIGNAVPPLLGAGVGSMFAPGTAVDLFSGVGGLSLGLKMAGHDVVAAVDHDAVAVAAYNTNTERDEEAFVADLDAADGRAATWETIQSRLDGRLDLLAGGPPCQGFSTAGKALKDDPRNRLLWSFVEGVEVLRPRAVLMENVVALAQSRGRAYLQTVVDQIRDLGYKVDVKVLHAEAYGVPQRRRRTILAATQVGEPAWPEPQFAVVPPTFSKLQPGTPSALPGYNVFDAIGNLPEEEGRDLDSPIRVGQPNTELQEWLQEGSPADPGSGVIIDSNGPSRRTR